VETQAAEVAGIIKVLVVLILEQWEDKDLWVLAQLRGELIEEDLALMRFGNQ
jgi:hypothetical protein